MKVLKFGGTSVGSASRMKDVARLINDGQEKIVVLSAMSGTTNTLVEIADYLHKRNIHAASETINALQQKYRTHVDELYDTDACREQAWEIITGVFDQIRSLAKDMFTLYEEKIILAQGEIISTNMFNIYLHEQGINSVLLPALDFVRTDKEAEPDMDYIKGNLRRVMAEHGKAEEDRRNGEVFQGISHGDGAENCLQKEEERTGHCQGQRIEHPDNDGADHECQGLLAGKAQAVRRGAEHDQGIDDQCCQTADKLLF